jgi:DNA-directed RNA polymerase specialized sigma24 family protein
MLRAPYAEDEVRALVSHYNVLKHHRHRLWIMVRLLDLELAVRKLDDVERGVLVLHGVHGWPQRDVADVLDISQSTVGRTFHGAFPKLVESMNGHD